MNSLNAVASIFTIVRLVKVFVRCNSFDCGLKTTFTIFDLRVTPSEAHDQLASLRVIERFFTPPP